MNSFPTGWNNEQNVQKQRFPTLTSTTLILLSLPKKTFLTKPNDQSERFFFESTNNTTSPSDTFFLSYDWIAVAEQRIPSATDLTNARSHLAGIWFDLTPQLVSKREEMYVALLPPWNLHGRQMLPIAQNTTRDSECERERERERDRFENRKKRINKWLKKTQFSILLLRLHKLMIFTQRKHPSGFHLKPNICTCNNCLEW